MSFSGLPLLIVVLYVDDHPGARWTPGHAHPPQSTTCFSRQTGALTLALKHVICRAALSRQLRQLAGPHSLPTECRLHTQVHVQAAVTRLQSWLEC